MSTGSNTNSFECQLGSWALAAGAAALALVLLILLGAWNFWAAALMAALIMVFLGLLLASVLCSPLSGPVAPGSAGRTPGDIELSRRARNLAGGTTAAAPAAAAPAAAAPAAAAPKPAAAKAAAAPVMKPSTELLGEAELDSRKGSWKYEGDGEATAKPAAATATPDYDKDGVAEGENEGTKPEMLSAPRGGTADNLKEIKGVGPKLEKMLHGMGFYHFDQIANWTPDEVAWVNANLTGFKGRVTRDDWVAQAKILAAGGETEFSKRVDKGDVY
jgi:predicted flap endonuclease-1-like 5' DNA nuclease